MKSFHVRPLTESDMSELVGLLETRDDVDGREEAEQRAELQRWIAFHNPFANEEPTYYVAEDEGRLVAYHGRMPVEFAINGELRKGYYVHDLYVEPESRRKGLGFWLTRSLAKKIEAESDAFFCLFGMTPLNRQMQRRFGYVESNAEGYVKALDPQKELIRRLKSRPLAAAVAPFMRLAMRTVDEILFLVYRSAVRVVEVDRFDERIDALNLDILPLLGVTAHKSSAFLNWKYADRPYRRDTLFVASRNGRLCGYAVATFTPKESEFGKGHILEIMADPSDRDTVFALCIQIIRHFRRHGTATIACILTDKRFIRLFRKLLFLPGPEGKGVMFGNLQHCEALQEMVKDVENWHMTRGESDGFMLSS